MTSLVQLEVWPSYEGGTSTPSNRQHALGILIKLKTSRRNYTVGGFTYQIGPAIFGPDNYTVAEDLGGIMIPPNAYHATINIYEWDTYLAPTTSSWKTGPSGCATGPSNLKGSSCPPGTSCVITGLTGNSPDGACQPTTSTLQQASNQIYIPYAISEGGIPTSVDIIPVQFVYESGKWTNCHYSCDLFPGKSQTAFTVQLPTEGITLATASDSSGVTQLFTSQGAITNWPSNITPNFQYAGIIGGGSSMYQKSTQSWDPLKYNPYATEIFLGR